jgi:hypothetical protein
MNPTSLKSPRTTTILWSLAWAWAMIVVAFLFKGNPAAHWIELGLLVGSLTLVVLKPQRVVCRAK